MGLLINDEGRFPPPRRRIRDCHPIWYTGQLYVGSSQSIPGSNGHGHSHNWIGDSGSKDAGAGVWKKATYKISPYSTAHVMFEAFGTSPKQYGFCSRTIIDDVL